MYDFFYILHIPGMTMQARDDPAFCFLQIIMLIISSIAYGLAFRVGSISAILGFVIKSILIHWLGLGIIMASLGSLIANKHLMQAERSSSHVKQNVEWLYAFDVHCNAFLPLFVLLCKLFLYCCYYFLFVCLDVYMIGAYKFSFYPASWVMLTYPPLRGRWSTILPIATCTRDISPVTRCFQYVVCSSIRLVLLHNTFGLQR